MAFKVPAESSVGFVPKEEHTVVLRFEVRMVQHGHCSGAFAAMSTNSHVLRLAAGAQIPLEDVPSVQKEVVMRCRQMGRPVIVASHLLQSMIEYPTPTRAEVCTLSDNHATFGCPSLGQ